MSLVADVAPVVDRPEIPVSMVERMTLILDAFDGPGSHLILEEVARRTHLPRSTAHRILDQLVQLGWLRHGSGGYALGPRVMALGAGDRAAEDLRYAAAPVVQDLALRTGLVVHLAVLEGASVRYLDKVGGRRAVDIPSRVGAAMPAHATALGKAMLAWLEPEDVDLRVSAVLAQRTSRTVRDLTDLHLELHRVRARGGLALEREECFSGIACVATAIRTADGPVAALSLVGTANAPLERAAPLLVRAARTVGAELAGQLGAVAG
jgi:DNA-binding IclR family transcriptional regulator